MSAVLQDEVYETTGHGWKVVLYMEHGYLTVNPAEDPVAAISDLLSPAVQRYWTVEWSGSDHNGWDVYLLERSL